LAESFEYDPKEDDNMFEGLEPQDFVVIHAELTKLYPWLKLDGTMDQYIDNFLKICKHHCHKCTYLDCIICVRLNSKLPKET